MLYGHQKRTFFIMCLLGCRIRILNRFLAVGVGKTIFTDFWHNSSSERQWRTRGESVVFLGKGGGQPRWSNSWKKSVETSQKSVKSVKKIGKHFFLLKWCQMHWDDHKTPFNLKNRQKHITLVYWRNHAKKSIKTVFRCRPPKIDFRFLFYTPKNME